MINTETEKLIQLSYILIEADWQNKWLYVNWTGEQTRNSKKEGCKMILHAVSRTGFTKVLNDNRELTALWDTSLDWIKEEWFPDLRKRGVTTFAWIYAADSLLNFSIAEFTRNIRNGPVIKSFTDIEEGKAWLARI